MEKKFDMQYKDYTGAIAVSIANNQTLNDFCVRHLANYNPSRFEAIGIRVFIGKETIITIYAMDKSQYQMDMSHWKIPTKKFKLTHLNISDLFSYCASLNFTLFDKNHDLEDMSIINK